MLRALWVAALICMTAGHLAGAEEATAEEPAASEDTRAIKVKTRTQKLAEACGVYDPTVQACTALRKACKRPVNASKAECQGLPPESAEVTE